MISLKKKKMEQQMAATSAKKNDTTMDGRASVRDRLLVREVQEMQQNLPKSCHIHFDDPNKLHKFSLTISPDEGYWVNGKFRFYIDVPEDYNIAPPKVRCSTKIWHPNINESGEVCLSLLRQNSIDSLGWAPTRKLKDVVWGLNALFSDLLNFEDPLNVEAAEHYERDKDAFIAKAKDYVQKYASKR